MDSNFNFLQRDFPVLFQIGSMAEKYLYTDFNSCIIKLGMFGESMACDLSEGGGFKPQLLMSAC